MRPLQAFHRIGLGVLLTGLALATSACGTPSTSSSITPATSPAAPTATPDLHGEPPTESATEIAGVHNVVTMHWLTASQGWVSGSDGLLWTNNAGQTWTPLNLPQVNSAEYEPPGFYVLDATHAWSVACNLTNQAPSFVVEFSADLGGSWTQLDQNTFGSEHAAPGMSQVDFVDPLHGWLVYSQPANSGVEGYATLFSTDDGGANWTQLSLPVPGAIRFTTTSLGYLLVRLYNANPVSGEYVTRDGGKTWQPAVYPATTPTGEAAHVDGLPTFFTPQVGIQGVDLGDAVTPSGAGLFLTRDGGLTWRFVAPGHVSAIPTAATWVTRGPSSAIFASADQGQTWSMMVTPYMGSDEDYLTAADGWSLKPYVPAVQSVTSIPVQGLMHTTDGGRTWQLVNP